MNLDDHSSFARLDPDNIIAEIDHLPDQLVMAWKLGLEQPLPVWKDIRQVLIAGVGGSAIGADLLAAYVSPFCTVPVIIHRDYSLPAWGRGEHTLLIASSHSGNTEEVLSAFDRGMANKCTCLAITTGGKLADYSTQQQIPLWKFVHKSQPRAAVGFSFGLLLSALARLQLIPDRQRELIEAVDAMRQAQEQVRIDTPVHKNPAKRLAGQLINRWALVIGAGIMAPVARRWKTQINEVAKAWAQFDTLPEVDHNTLAGLYYPSEMISNIMALFLRSDYDAPRNRMRSELTRREFMLQGANTDFVDARGDSALANMWTTLHFGDYVAYYLAMAYSVDPAKIELIEGLKREMEGISVQ